MANFTPEAAHVPGCIPPELRQCLGTVTNLIRHMIDGDRIQIDVQTVGGESTTEIHNAGNLTGNLPVAVFAGGNIYVEATLGSSLASGGTQVVGGRTLNGKFIRSGRSLPSGTLVGAIWNGTDYSIIVANKCDE